MNALTSHALAAIFGAILLTGYSAYRASTKIVESVIAPQAKEVEKIVWKTIACPGIKVAPDKTRKALGVPDAIQGDVVAAVRIAGDEYPHTITGIYSAETMAVTLLDRRDPLPWLQAKPRYALGLHYGTDFEDIGVWRVSGGYTAFQTKLIHWDIIGTTDVLDGSVVNKFLGVGGQIRWR